MTFNFGSFSSSTPTTMSTTGTNGINFGLGSNTAQGSGGFQMGQSAAPASSTGFGSLSFGSNATTVATVNPLLAGSGITTATVNPLLGGATAAGGGGGGFNFGAGKLTGTAAPITAATTSGFSFATGAAPATIAAAVGASTSAVGGFSLPGFPSSSTTSGGFAALPAASSAAAPFSFGTAVTSTTSAGLGGTSTLSAGLGGSAAPSLGLGGAQPPAATAGDASGGGQSEGKASKETPLPQDIFATIAAFETFKGEEKAASEANLRQSAASFHKLGEDCKKLRCHVTQLATLHDSLQRRVNALKEKIITDSECVEMARRTQSTPAQLQGDNTAPEQYFAKAVERFEARMLACRERIEEVEKCLAVAGNTTNNDAALRELVRRQHDDLQVAASHVYRLHSKLIQLNAALPCPEDFKPRPMFRAGTSQPDGTRSAVPEESAVIRSCFDLPGGESRLGAFQLNVAKARALSINPAPPPTQGLNSSSLFGTNTNFNSGSTFGLQGTSFVTGGSGTSSFGTGGGAFGPNFSSGTSAFNSAGNSSFGGGPSAFGGGNTSGFGSNNNTQAGSLFSSTFAPSNKLFKT